MVNTKINLSMKEPYVRQIYAKQGDTGRVLEIGLEDATLENGTLRILRPDGLEKTSDAITSDSPTITDGMATFDSLDEAEVTSLKVGISPVQDLNGYDAPWVGGAGKNKLPPSYASGSPYTINGITYTNTDGVVKVSGTPTGDAYYILFPNTDGQRLPLKAGTYTISCAETTANCRVNFNVVGVVSSVLNANQHSYTFTVSSDAEMFANILTDGSSAVNLSLHIQIESGSTATSWSPYSNVCPIYAGNGKNLSPTSVATTTSAGNINASSGSFGTVVSGQTYTISFVNKTPITSNLKVRINDGNTQTDQVQHNLVANGKNSYTFTASKDGTVVFNGSTDASYSSVVVFEDVQLELGGVATFYAPYQGISVEQVGFNLWNGEIEQGSLNTTTGAESATTARCRNRGYIQIDPSVSYYFKGDYATYLFFYDKNGKYLGYASTSQVNKVFNPTTLGYASAKFMRFRYDNSGDVTDKKICINVSSDRNGEYQPYLSHTYPISLGQSVYGGTLDVVGGKLTITHAIQDLGALSWTKDTGAVRFYASLPSAKTPSSNDATFNGISSMFVAKSLNYLYPRLEEDGLMALSTGGVLSVRDISLMSGSATAFATAMSGQSVVYELATPTEVDLTPTQITTLIGTNNMWADGEISELTFDYGKLLSVLTADQTEVVGRCLGDVNFGGASTMPFTLVVKPNNKENA